MRGAEVLRGRLLSPRTPIQFSGRTAIVAMRAGRVTTRAALTIDGELGIVESFSPRAALPNRGA